MNVPTSLLWLLAVGRQFLYHLTGRLGRTAALMAAAGACVLPTVAQPITTNVVIPTNSTWRFLRGTAEASSPTNAWRFLSFNDSGWQIAPAPFHYGTNSAGGDDGITGGTILSDMRSNYTCIYLRREFVVPPGLGAVAVRLRLNYDDGYAVWLNGVRIHSFAVPVEPAHTNSTTLQREAVTVVFDALPGSHTNVVAGTNILCVQAFNFGATNDDFRIDPELYLGLAEPPVVAQINSSAVPNLFQVGVTFSQPVTNVQASDLIVGGSPADAVSGTGSNYIFSCSRPEGVLLVSWASSQRIKNTLGVSFDPSGLSWLLTNSVAPLTVRSVFPAPGTSVNELKQATVVFNAFVTGIEPADFLINGTSAETASGANSTWTFTFKEPPPGTVQFSWDASHAIYDGAGRKFDHSSASANWSVTLNDIAAPTLASVLPAPGSTLHSFSQVEVMFREAVKGVSASDLRVNGVAAVSVIGSDAGPYLFTFTQPSSGVVNLSWAPAHGITDGAGNLFAGGTWSYTLSAAPTPNIVINEIMADNLTGIEDEDGDTSDWIELYNAGTAPVSLLGWSLTADPAEPGMWPLPDLTLSPGEFLLLYASGKDRIGFGSYTNHTSFTLGESSYVGLFSADLPAAAVSEFSYPLQRADISFGRGAGDALVYFATPTPKAPNAAGTSFTGAAATPNASVDSGLFDAPFSVALSSTTLGTTIYYTVDGSVPSPSNGVVYTQPIVIAGTAAKGATPLRAVSYKAGMLPSTVLTRTYIFPAQVLSQPITPAGYPNQWVSNPQGTPTGSTLNRLTTLGDYEMDPQVLNASSNAQVALRALRELPVVSLVSSIGTIFAPTTGVYTARAKQGNQRSANVEMWLPDGSQLFNVDCGFEIQGGSSPTDASGDWKEKKLSMRLIFRGDFGTPKLKVRLFEDSPVDEFDTLILDAGMNWWWTHMTDADQRNRAKFVTDQFTSDLMNRAGMVAMHGRHVHLYINGLYWGIYNIHERMDDAAAASYFGGKKEDWDVLKHTGDSAGLQNGTLTNYTAMMQVARSGLANNSVYERLQTFLDVPWFIDYMLVNFWTGNDDWPHHNWYAWRSSRIPGSPGWRFISWDAEHTIKRWDYDFINGNAANLNAANTPGELYRLLVNNNEFRLLFGDRVHKHMFNGGALYSTPNSAAIWSPTNPSVNIPASLYRKRVDEIWNSIVCESARWGDVATARASQPYTRDLEYARELNALFSITNVSGQTPNYFPLRGSNVLAQLRAARLYPNVVAPAFSQHGAAITPGTAVTMAASHTIYFTTNGTDPRVYGLNSISPSAQQYTGPINIAQTMTVKARALSGTNWSALNEATFTVAQLASPLRVVEFMYNPVGGDAYEFIELQNTGGLVLDLGGAYFDGIDFLFPPGSMLAAGGRLVLGSNNNTNAWKSRYPGVAVTGWFGGRLSNTGERITIFDRFNEVLFTLDYRNSGGWPAPADGRGYSLEVVDAEADPDDPANWRASSVLHGTPGVGSSAPVNGLVILNEVMADNASAVRHAGEYPDWVELYNPGGAPVDLAGYSLSDNANLRQFVFPPGTVVQGGGYLVVWCDTNSAAPGLHAGFNISRSGESLFLYDAATNRVDAIGFGQQLTDYTLGRIGDQWTLTVPTPGTVNVAAVLADPSSISINEWLANPPTGGADWIELFNRSGTAPAALRNMALGAGTALFQMPVHAFIEPRGFLQLFADEEPGRIHLDFKLSSSGESVRLVSATGALVDQVSFSTQIEGVSQGRLPDGASTITAFSGSVSPGGSNYVLVYNGPVLHEILARNQGGVPSPFGAGADYIELFNPATTNVDLGGMSLTDDLSNPTRFTFAPGTLIAPGGYLIVWCVGDAASSSTGVLNAGFGLSGSAGGVYLFNNRGQLVNSVEYGPQVANQSIGRSAGEWELLSLPTPGTANAAPATLGSTLGLRFNEWMAQPSSDADWFELYNTNASPVNLSGLFLSDDPSIAGRTNTRIAPLSYIGPRDFARFIADATPALGANHVNFSLGSDGESLVLLTTNQAVIDIVTFGLQAAGISEGRLPDGAANIVSFPATPTPEASNYLPLQDVVINEVLSRSSAPLEDAIELLNTGASSVAIGGWWLSDSERVLRKYVIAAGTVLNAGSFRVFYENQFNAGPAGTGTNFTLNAARGGTLYLTQTTNDQPTGFRAQLTFGAAQDAVSFGRVATSIGSDVTAMAQRTFGVDNPGSVTQFRTGTGLPNSAPKIGPVVINEIHYHPISGTNSDEAATEEFIELFNTSGSTQPLFDAARPANTWRLAGGVSYSFATNAVIPPLGYVMVANFNPANGAQLAAFRAKYGSNGTVVGPFSGRLNNSGEAIELYRPDSPVAAPDADAGYVPQLLVDRVDYGVTAPWVSAADGGGASLQRRAPSLYGNDPANWKAEAPTAGRTNATTGGAPPIIISQPLDRNVVAGGTATFSVAVSGQPTLAYQWQRFGTNIPGAVASTLVIQNVQTATEGDYRVIVSNSTGSIVSDVAVLRVLVPPAIAVQPQSQTVVAGASVLLSVGVSGSEPISYQWRINQANLAGEDENQLSFASIQPGQGGAYSVVVSNPVGAVTSVVAVVTVLVPPTITGDPTDASVAAGQAITFGVSATGTAPLSYQWRRNGQPIPGATAVDYTIFSVQPEHQGAYDVVVSNAAGHAFSAVAVLTVSASVGPVLGAPRVLPNGAFQFTVGGISNRSYAIDVSANLTTWNQFSVVTLTNRSSTVIDSAATNTPLRFYRARELGGQ